MSVQDALGISPDAVDRIIRDRWPAWAAAHPKLPSQVDSCARLHRWIRSSASCDTDDVLRIMAMRAHIDDYDDRDAAAVLAFVMLPAAALIAHKLRSMDREIDAHVAAHLWIQARTTPWRSRGRIAIGLRWRVWRYVVQELSPPEGIDGAVPDIGSLVRPQSDDPRCADDEISDLVAVARRSGDLTRDDVLLLMAVLDASSAAVPDKARGAALLGDRVSDAVAPLHGTSPRSVRRRTRSCIETLRRLASA